MMAKETSVVLSAAGEGRMMKLLLRSVPTILKCGSGR